MGRFHRYDDGTEHSHDHNLGHSHVNSDASDGHGDHSGYQTGVERVQVLERIFDENDHAAAENRAAFDSAGVTCVNLMSGPGAGKTTLLARTLKYLQENAIRAGVIEGDIETSIDADRLTGFGAQISLLNTGDGFGGECHLDAPMVARALGGLDLTTLDLVMIENVGNLVCPAEFDVGAHSRVMVCAVTEGEEKPLKYPVMFRSVDLVLVNKVDLVPHLDVDVNVLRRNIEQVNPGVKVFELSARTGQGVADWHAWLTAQLAGGVAGGVAAR